MAQIPPNIACQCRIARPPWSGVSHMVHRTTHKPSVQMLASPQRSPRRTSADAVGTAHVQLVRLPRRPHANHWKPALQNPCLPARPQQFVCLIRGAHTTAPKEQPVNHRTPEGVVSNRATVCTPPTWVGLSARPADSPTREQRGGSQCSAQTPDPRQAGVLAENLHRFEQRRRCEQTQEWDPPTLFNEIGGAVETMAVGFFEIFGSAGRA